MATLKNLKNYFKRTDIITVYKVQELFKISYPWAKNIILENEVKGIVIREEVGKRNAKRQTYVWKLK